MQAHGGASADRAHRLGLCEDLGVAADSDFQVLRPDARRDQRPLQRQRLVRARHHVAQAVAQDRGTAGADLLGLPGIARGLLLDHAFQHGRDEGDAAGLHRLKVVRREEEGAARVRRLGRVGGEFGQAAQALPRRGERGCGGILGFEQRLQGRDAARGDVENAFAVDPDDRRPGHIGPPDAAGEKSGFGQVKGAGHGMVTSRFLGTSCPASQSDRTGISGASPVRLACRMFI